MAELRVAKRYVKSLLSLAAEHDSVDAVHADMLLFAKACRESRPLRVMLESPVIRHEKKKEVLRKIFTGKVSKLTMALIEMLTRKNREPLLPAIASEFHNAYNEYKGIGKASITTTTPMDKDVRKAMEGIVRKLSNKKLVDLSEKVDPDLIGGFVLLVDDRLIDASIRSKLKVLSLKFKESHFVKGV